VTVSEYLDAGFEVAALPSGREPDSTTRLYYDKMTLLGTRLPYANLAVRSGNVFAIRYFSPPDGVEDSEAFRTLKAAGSLLIYSPALAIGVFLRSFPDYVHDGGIGVGPLAGCRLITGGFLAEGTHDFGARSYELQSEGVLKRPTDELAAILSTSGLYRVGA
jgi:hypothetical protein